MQRALSPALLCTLSGFVDARLGLHFPEERWGDLERSVAATARELGLPDTETCARWLLAMPSTRSHIDILASQLTVGETYFFREPRSLEVIEQYIVPEWLRRRRDGERHLRIWSAGCCTGEEPYSVAMLLDRLLPDFESWNVTVLATDINPRFLRKAARGLYGEWSFRGTPDWVRARYFRHRQDGRWELLAHIRERVTFSYLNLADDAYPSLLNGTHAMDMILCRNVLMYFTAERARRVAMNFHRALAEGGWLVVSPAETSSTLFSSFSAVDFPGAVIYRKHAGDALPTPIPDRQARPLALDLDATPKQALTITPEAAAAEMLPSDPQRESGDGPRAVADTDDPVAAEARRLANQGRLAEAAEWCRKAIAADKLNPARHYLLATIQQEQGETDAAAQSLTRALYLAPGFALAQFALGNIELSRGRRREAERHFTNALATLREHAQDDILPESEGLTAGRLIEIVASALAKNPPRAGVQA